MVMSVALQEGVVYRRSIVHREKQITVVAGVDDDGQETVFILGHDHDLISSAFRQGDVLVYRKSYELVNSLECSVENADWWRRLLAGINSVTAVSQSAGRHLHHHRLNLNC